MRVQLCQAVGELRVHPLNQRISSHGVVSSLKYIRQYENITLMRNVHSLLWGEEAYPLLKIAIISS
jgi:hypothetical protein